MDITYTENESEIEVIVYSIYWLPHAHAQGVKQSIDTVKIVSVDRMLTLNLIHQTTEAWRKGSLRLKEI